MYKNSTFIDNNFKITGIQDQIKKKRQAWYLTWYVQGEKSLGYIKCK